MEHDFYWETTRVRAAWSMQGPSSVSKRQRRLRAVTRGGKLVLEAKKFVSHDGFLAPCDASWTEEPFPTPKR